MRDARWRVGPWRFAPWYTITDLGYNSNVFGTSNLTKADLTVTVGAGVRGYVGSTWTLAVHALPEYVWWRELTNRRSLNGRFGAGLFGYLDHLTLEVEATSSKQQSYVSSEFEQLVNTLRQRGAAAVEVEFSDRLAVFASASTERWEYDESDQIEPVGRRLSLLDRTEDVARGGLRYRFQSGLALGAGLEYSDVDFAHPEDDRSNFGAAPLVELRFQSPGVYIDVSAALRSLEPKEGSVFRPFDGTTGSFTIAWRPGSRLGYHLYGHRNLVYTLLEGSSYYVDERVGVGLTLPIGWRFRTGVFVEGGKDDFVMIESSAEPRKDDVLAYGGVLSLELGSGLEFGLRVSQVDYESNFERRSRSIFRVQAGITLGDSDSPWF